MTEKNSGPAPGSLGEHRDRAREKEATQDHSTGKPPENQVKLSLFNGGIQTTTPTDVVDDWDEFVDLVTVPKIGPKDGDYFVRGICNGPREDAALDNMDMVVLDGDRLLDGGDSCCPPDAVHNALKAADFTHVIYSSHSADPDKGKYKWRVVLPCPEVKTKADLEQAVAEVVTLLHSNGLPVRNVKENNTPSQPWYLPRCRDANALEQFYCAYHDGKPWRLTGWTLPEAQANYRPPKNNQEGPQSDGFSWDGVLAQFESGTLHQGLVTACGWFVKTTDWSDRQIKDFVLAEIKRLCPDIEKVNRASLTDEIDKAISYCRDKQGHAAPEILVDLESAKANNLLATTPPPRRYVVEGLLPEPVAAAIVAPGSTGKSMLIKQLATSVASGAAFFGHEIARPGAVLMLAAEDDLDEVARRLHSIVEENGFTPEQVRLIGSRFYPVSRLGQDNRLTTKKNGMVEWNLPLIESIIATALSIPDLRLIIIDPVSRFRAGDENANEDATKFVEALETIRHKTNVSVLCAHHSRKGSTGDSQDDIRGASAFVDALRFAATLYSPTPEKAAAMGIPEDERRSFVKFTVVKSNYKTAVDEFWLRRGRGGVLFPIDAPEPLPTKAAVKGEERYSAALPKLKDMIRKADQEGEPLTKTFITRNHSGVGGVFGVGDQALRGIISRAIDEGEISQADDGKLRLY